MHHQARMLLGNLLFSLLNIILAYIITRDNTEKTWTHRFYAKQKTDVPKARKMAAVGLGSAVSPLRVAKPPKSVDFFCLNHDETVNV